MSVRKSGQIVNVMKEGRLFPPPAEFAAKARIGSLAEYERMWEEAAADPEGFWGRLAGELHWFKPYEEVLRWNEPLAEWFVGGQTNVSYNCLDAHLADRGERDRLDLGGRAGRGPPLHLSPTPRRSLPASPTSCGGWAWARATSWRSTCRWSPSWQSPCWPAPASARSIRWSPADSPRKRSPTATTTPARSS